MQHIVTQRAGTPHPRARDVMRRLTPLVCVLVLLTPRPAAPQSGVGQGQARVIIRAARTTQPLTIDGRLDEAVYRDVPPLTEFIQNSPDVGAPMTEKTEAWVLFDDENVYITCRCWHEHPENIVANDMQRDSANLSQHDHFAVGLDTFNDGRNGFQFGASAAGGARDGTLADGAINADWNAVWEWQTRRFEGGWVIEMAIPFKSLRYQAGRQQTWRIQLRRLVRSKNELGFITPTSPARGISALQYFTEAATLVGLEAPPPALNLEVKPYAISHVTTDLVAIPPVRNDFEPAGGLDIKYGLTKSLTADFTYNTDFAQVEADEAQVNLTRFSLLFPEKRDFFLEGQGVFQFGGGRGGDVGNADVPRIFYSRRIGLNGGRDVPVIAGGRVTGKAGPWNIGMLDVATDSDVEAGVAQTNFSVLSLRRDILRRSSVGGMFTRRSASTISPGANDVWGLDANFAFYENVYLSGYVARSRTANLTGDDLSYRTQFNYAADRYGLALERLVVEENVNPEVGFLRRRDFRRNVVSARFSPRTTHNRLVRKWVYDGSLNHITDNQNRLQARDLVGGFRTEFHNGNGFEVQYRRLYELLVVPFEIGRDVRVPAGGYDFDDVAVSYTVGQQRRISGSTSFETGHLYDGGRTTAAFKGRVNVSSHLGVEPTISLNWIDLPYGEFTTTVIGGRATFSMTPRMFAAALVQYSSSSSSLSANLRFRWEYQPGSEFFIVYSDGRSTLPLRGTELQSRGLVVKINRLFRF